MSTPTSEPPGFRAYRRGERLSSNRDPQWRADWQSAERMFADPIYQPNLYYDAYVNGFLHAVLVVCVLAIAVFTAVMLSQSV